MTAALRRSRCHPGGLTGTGRIAVATGGLTAPCGGSPWFGGLSSRDKDYVARRTAEGKTKTEIMRCLKRYSAREVFPHLLTAAPAAVPARPESGQAG